MLRGGSRGGSRCGNAAVPHGVLHLHFGWGVVCGIE